MNMYQTKAGRDGMTIFIGTIAILVVLIGVFRVWLTFFAPCDVATSLPIMEVPVRCLK